MLHFNTATRPASLAPSHDARKREGFLGKVPAFSSMRAEDLRRVASLAVVHRLVGGEFLFMGGDSVCEVFAVASGHIKLSLVTLDGREMTVGILSPGELFGNLALGEG